MRHLLALALALAPLFAANASTQVSPPSSKDNSQYTRTVWRVSDGLPEDTVQALAESARGLLWIGTTGGLARFDGSRMQMYEAGRAQLSSVNSIFCLTVSRNGDIWAGTEGGGLLRSMRFASTTAPPEAWVPLEGEGRTLHRATVARPFLLPR